MRLAHQAHLDIGDLPQLVKIDGLWTRCASEIGWGHALRSAGDSELLEKLLSSYLPQFLQDLQQLCATIRTSELAVIADDLAGVKGLLIDPKILESSLFELYSHVPSMFSSLAFHSDGDVGDLLGIVSQSGFTHIHLAGVGLSKFAELAEKAHRAHLIPMGGYGVATADDPELATTISRLQESSGLICADDAGLTSMDQIKKYLDFTTMIV